MSMDIGVKPVGLPTASPFISSSDAAREGVPTQLPPQKTVTPADPVTPTRNEPQPAQSATNKVVIDKAAAAIVFQTVDDRTGDVIGQYPAEGTLRRRAYVRALDMAKADANADKTPPTDLKI